MTRYFVFKIKWDYEISAAEPQAPTKAEAFEQLLEHIEDDMLTPEDVEVIEVDHLDTCPGIFNFSPHQWGHAYGGGWRCWGCGTEKKE